MTPSQSSSEFLNTTQLTLYVGTQTLHPTHISNDEAIFSSPLEIQSGHATVEVVINGNCHTFEAIILPHSGSVTRVPLKHMTSLRHTMSKSTPYAES